MDYKKKYYRLLATFWIAMIIGFIFLWNIHDTLDEIQLDIVEMEKRKEHEIIQAWSDAGWLPYDATNEEE